MERTVRLFRHIHIAYYAPSSFVVAFILLIRVIPAMGQVTVSGTVTDAESGLPIPGVTVSVLPGEVRTATDTAGHFKLQSQVPAAQIEFRTLGYHTLSRTLSGEPHQEIQAAMEVDYQMLDAIVISERGRYRNRNNPAVELLQKVIDNKARHRPGRFPYQKAETYEKTLIALSEVPRFIQQNWLTKGYRFIFENKDSTLVPGYTLLPAFLEETFSTQYRGGAIGPTRTYIRARKMTELDPRYVDNSHIRTYLRFLQQELDLYSKDIMIAGKAFLSPIADIGPYFYRYYITDTVAHEGRSFAELSFLPRNAKSYLFSGKMEVDLKDYGIRKAHLQVDKHANFNWLKRLNIHFTYKRSKRYGYLPEQAEFEILAGLPATKTGVYAARTQTFNSYEIGNEPPGNMLFERSGSLDKPDEFWVENRPLPLTPSERQTYVNMEKLRGNQAFKRTLSWVSFLSDGFVQAGPLDVGPLEYAYSFNSLEGNRIRLGGKTGRDAERPYFLQGYLAYGTRDTRFKYYLHAAHSLNKRPIARFPAHYLEASYQQDIRQPGFEMGFLNGDSFFQSFRRDDQERYLFKRRIELRHVLEFKNHLAIRTHFARLYQEAAYGLTFRNGRQRPDTLGGLTHGELGLRLRWAPGEQIIQKQLERTNIPNQLPVFSVQYTLGIQGLFGGGYNFQRLQASAFKRFYLSQLGMTDATINAGYIWGDLPYLLLDIPNANASYILSPDSYQLLNEMEFVNDRFLKIDLQHHFQGLLLNRIPLIKKLGWRESAGIKVLYGGLRPENDPAYNPGAIRFPLSEQGTPSTFAMGQKPYMEFNAGIENILNFLQIQYIRRLSYLGHPDVDRDGFRFSIKFDF